MPENEFFSSMAFREVVARFYPENLRDDEQRWLAYREELRAYAQAAEAASRAVDRLVVQPACRRSPGRFVCCLDWMLGSGFTKSPMSIDDKIFRYLSDQSVAGHKVNTAAKQRLERGRANQEVFLSLFFRELPDVMNDLARFRIIANFLSDVRDLHVAFAESDLDPPNIEVDHGAIEDRIEEDRWEQGATGHRAVHARVWVRLEGRRIHVEVLIMSLLQLGWDAKTHLWYELTRRGGEALGKRERLKVQAMSDALYVADSLFDEVLRGQAYDEDVS